MLLLAPIGAQTVEPLVLPAEAVVLYAEVLVLYAEAMVLQLKWRMDFYSIMRIKTKQSSSAWED